MEDTRYGPVPLYYMFWKCCFLKSLFYARYIAPKVLQYVLSILSNTKLEHMSCTWHRFYIRIYYSFMWFFSENFHFICNSFNHIFLWTRFTNRLLYSVSTYCFVFGVKIYTRSPNSFHICYLQLNFHVPFFRWKYDLSHWLSIIFRVSIFILLFGDFPEPHIINLHKKAVGRLCTRCALYQFSRPSPQCFMMVPDFDWVAAGLLTISSHVAGMSSTNLFRCLPSTWLSTAYYRVRIPLRR